MQNGKEASLTECKQNPKCPDVCRRHGSSWAGWGLLCSSPLLEICHHPRDYVLLHEHSVLQMPPGASWHLYLLSVEQALLSNLREKQDCSTSCTQDKPHSAAPPRAHLESGDFLAAELLGEGNGNPLQYSCLENPMDRGAW